MSRVITSAVLALALAWISADVWAALCIRSGWQPAACSFWVAASGGSDSNPGTSSQPFATLGKLQTTLQGSGTKVGCLKAGTYSPGSILVLGTLDNGETWQSDPAGGVNSTILDGGGTVDLIQADGNSLTFDGLKLQNCFNYCIHHDNGSNISNLTIKNSDIGSNKAVTENSFPGLIHINGFNGLVIKNNYFHDALSQCTAAFAFAGATIAEGLDIENNVYLRCVQQVNDGGAIYQEFFDNYTATSCVIKNNYVRDSGGPGMNDVHDVYLDQGTNHCQVSGNVLGPPSTNNPGNSTGAFLADGHDNSFSGNLIDLGASGKAWSGVWWSPASPGFTTSGNSFSGNIVIENFAGSLATNAFGVGGTSCTGGTTACAYVQVSQGVQPSISNNAYHNYGGGQELTVGNSSGDSSPQHLASGQLGLSCTNGIYSIVTGAAVLGSPINFPQLVRGWGPPGFVIPSSTNHSC